MNKLLVFQGLASAMTLCLPLSTAAQVKRADPAEASTPAPALRYRSTFDDYKPWRELQPGAWRAINDTVRDAGGHGAHGKPGAHDPHGGHPTHGGKP